MSQSIRHLIARSRILLLFATALCATGCDDGNPAAADPVDSGDSRAPDDTTDAPDDAAADAADAGVRPLRGAAELVDLVDPFVGAGGLGFGYASLTPAAQRPLSWVRLGPDTTSAGNHPDIQHFSGYFFPDPDVRGFSHTHFIGTGAADYANLRALPLATLDDRDPWRRFVTQDRPQERAAPGVYETRLEGGVGVELTTTDWAGLHRYTWDDGGGHLQLDFAASVNDTGVQQARIERTERGVEGFVVYRGGYVGRQHPFTLYVSATIDAEPSSTRFWDADGLLTDGTDTVEHPSQAGVLWSFPAQVSQVEMRVGLSVVSLDNARVHREQTTDQTFDEIVVEAREAWTRRLEGVRIATPDDEVAAIFATAAYNAWRMPSRWDEHDGRFLGLDGEIHPGIGGAYYTDLSLWDTFRTLHPWYTLVAPAVQTDCLRSLLTMAEALDGRMPRWPAAASATGGMLGASADVLFGGSAAKGVEGIDWTTALDVLWDANFGTTYEPPLETGREGAPEYVELGYVPADIYDEAASLTLEYAWNDFALAELAAVVGDAEREATARERARSWSRLVDDNGFLMPRLTDGSFDPDASTTVVYQRSGPFTEGTAWHWRFYALHDPDALADAVGSAAFEEALEEFFARSALGEGDGRVDTLLPDRFYWHGNEPAIHAAYLFHAVDRYDRAAWWIRQIQTRLYGLDPAGIPGNDDGGTLSSWYLFSALGLYPLAGSDTYVLGSPLVERAEIDLADGTTLTIEAPGAGVEVWEVEAVTINGRPVEGGRLRHAELSDATLRFEMRATR